MNLKRILALSVLLTCYATGCADDSKEDDKNVVDACSNITTPSCDNANGWIKACSNGTIDRVQCDNATQVCDPTQGCIAKTPNPDDDHGQTGADDKDACKNVTAPSCDGNKWVKSCTDGVIDSVECVEGKQTCDPVKGCVDIEEETTTYACKDDKTLVMCIGNECLEEDCSKKTNGKTICGASTDASGKATFDCIKPTYEYTAECKDNVLVVCAGKDDCADFDCSETLQLCDANAQECVDPATPNTCENGVFQIHDANGVAVSIDCKANTGGNTTCNAEKGCIYSETSMTTCENNSLFLAEGADKVEIQNCTITGQLCDAEKEACVDAGEGSVKCEGASTVVVYSDKASYKYDCSTRSDDKLGCNTVYGCSDIYCKGSEVYLCSTGAGCELYGDCADDGQVCSEAVMDCADSCDASTPVSCSGDVEYKCIGGVMVPTDCAAKGQICNADQGGCYDYVELCGNGIIDPGEVCDPGGIGGAAATVITGKSCSDWNGTDYEFIGEISCGASGTKNACKVVSDKCYKSTDRETKEEGWTFSGDLGSYKNSGAIDLNGGFKTSIISSAGGWTTGTWLTGSSPDFNSKYIQYNPSAAHAADLDAFASASIRFNVYRNDAGPKRMKIAMYSGKTQVATSREITVETKSASVIVPIYKTAQYTDTFTFRIVGYMASSSNGGTLTIDNMEIWTSTK